MIRTPILAVAFAALMSGQAFAKDSVTLGIVLEPPHLDPTAGAAAAIDEIVYANVFEGLTRIDRNGEVKPLLAKSWEIAEDGRSYTFQLAEGVTFHDGSSFDAEDVKFSLDRARAADSTNAQKALFEAISAVEVVSPKTVKVSLNRAAGDLLFNLGWGDAVIVAPESADANKEKPVGTGPFRFGDWAKGSAITIERNDSYWGAKPALAKATFRVIPDPSAAIAALQSGDVDGFPNFPAPEAVDQFKADPRFAVVIGNTEGETILSINNSRPPFDNVKVRQALAHAIDRKAIIDGAMFGQGTPIGTHFSPTHPAYVKELVDTYAYDPAKAKALLAEAGQPTIKARLQLPPPSYARRGGEIIAAQLREVGVETEIVPVEWKQWLEGPFKGDFDLTIVSHTEPMDIGIYARPDYYFRYDSKAFQDLYGKLNETTDQEGRYAIMRDLQKMITTDAVNVFLFELAKTGIWDAKLQGVWENSPVQANDLTEVRWAQ